MRNVNTTSRYPVLVTLLLGLLTLLAACDIHTEADESENTITSVLGPEHLAIVINDADPLSKNIGEYYIARRAIPINNVIRVSFKPGSNSMQPDAFKKLKAAVDRQTPSTVQAYVLAWTTPYKVGCMSITTAFAAGFDEGFCARGCKPTRASPYFDSNSTHPFTDFNWRPTIMLAGKNLESVKKLIDRGVAADGSRPGGTAYLLSTSDKARNTRARFYPGIQTIQSDRFRVKIISSDILKHRTDVMFYFTGLPSVAAIDSNTYRPGAIADHLTSAGGKLTASHQMSSLRWLSAGATGSYGTVVEPCAFVQKFPRPNIVINRYLNGETLLEAYWKSVEWPGQGVFIGEPLATPFSN